MAEEQSEKLTPEEVARRLRELAELYALGKALREVRFVAPAPPVQPDRVREQPDV